MKRILITLTTLLILLLPVSWAGAGVAHYADLSDAGSTNQGTFAEPFNTIALINAHAFATGDDLYFKAGTNKIVDTHLVVDWVGTSGDHAIIGAYDGDGDFDITGSAKPILNGNETVPSNNENALILILSATHVGYIDVENIKLVDSGGHGLMYRRVSNFTIDGVEVDGSYRNGIYVDKGNNVAGESGVIKNCDVTNFCTGWATGGVSAWGAALAVASTNNTTIQYNKVHEGYGEGIYSGTTAGDYTAEYNIIEYNVVYDCRAVNIYMFNSPHNIVRYNLSYGTGNSTYNTRYVYDGVYYSGAGIYTCDEDWASGFQDHYVQIYGNIVAFTQSGLFIDCSYVGSEFRDSVVYNNTFIDNYYDIRISGQTFSNSNIKNNIFWRITADAGSIYSGSDTTTGLTWSHNYWSVDPCGTCDADDNMVGPGTPGLSKTTGWRAMTAGVVVGTEFKVVDGSSCIDAGLDLGSTYVNALTTGTNFSTSPPTVVTDSQASHTPWEIGAWLYDSGTGPPPPPANPDITFWWRCENVTLDGTLDFTAGDGVAAASGGSEAINIDAVRIGTNGLDAAATGSYYSFDVATNDIVSGTTGRMGFWLKKNTIVSQTVHVRIYQDDSNKITFRTPTATDELQVYWRAGAADEMFMSTTTADMVNGTWYYVEFAYDAGIGAGSDYAEIWIDGISKVTVSNETLTPIAPVSMQIGIFGTFASDVHIDNIAISSNKTTDLFFIRNETAYPTGSPTIDAIGTATVTAGVVTFTANRTPGAPITATGNPGWYFALQLSEQPDPYATPEPSELRWDSGPLTASYADAPYYGCLPDVGGTYYLLYDPNLAIGHRVVNPQAYGDGSAAIIMNDAVIQDGDGNALATDFSLLGVDFDGTGTITITVPYPSGTPAEFSSSSTIATWLAAGGYFLPLDFIECTKANSIGTVDLSASDGTAGNVITIDGGGFGENGKITLGDYYLLKNIILN